MADEGTAEAKRLIAERRYADAIVVCRRLLLLGPDKPEARLLLGEALLASERWDEVRVEMLALIRRSPTEAVAHRLLGEAFLRDGQPDKAKEPLARAVELAPDDPIARELAEEAASEPFKDAHTIERWFGDDEGRTVETSLPEFSDEDTPAPTQTAAPAFAPRPIGMDEPSIEIDPSLAEELRKLEGEGAADITQPMPPSSAQAAGLRSLLAGAGPKATKQPVQRSGKPTLMGVAAPAGVLGAARGAPVAEARKPAGVVPKPGGAAGGQTAVARPGATPKPGPAPNPIEPPGPARPGAARALASPTSEAEPLTTELPLGTLDEDDDDDPDAEATGRLKPLAPSVRPPAPAPSVRPGPGLPRSPAPASRAPPGAPAPLASSAFPPPRASPGAFPPPRASPGAFPPPRASPGAFPPPRASPSAFPPPRAAAPSSAPASHASSATPSLPPLSPAPMPPRSQPASPAPLDPGAPPPAPARPFLGGRPGSGIELPTRPRIRSPAEALQWVLGPGDPRRRLAMIGGGSALAVATLVFLGWLACGGDGGLADAVRLASTDGRPLSYETALALAPTDEGGPTSALRARLLASSSLELGTDRFAEADALLSGLDPVTAGSAEARVARALVAIGRGQPEQGLLFLSDLEALDVTLVEAFRARALALAALGQFPEALDAARQAATLAPEAPRHAAFLASAALAAGDTGVAMRALGDATRAISLRVARAEIDLADGGDLALATADAEAVLAAPDVTGPERARTLVVRARILSAAGNAAGSLVDLGAAEALVPSWDEPTRLSLAGLFLSASEPARARAILAPLPAVSAAPRLRAELTVRAALALDDIPAADAAVGAAGTGPHIDMLRARIAEAAGRLDEARTFYASAAAEPTLLVAARTAEGAILYARGSMAEARTALASAIAVDPGEPRAVLLFVRAALAGGDRVAAERACRGAQALHPELPEIVAASGLVALATGHAEEAFIPLTTATAAFPTDLDLRLDLATADWQRGRLPEAVATIDGVLASAATNQRALGLSVDIALERALFDAAQAALDRLVTAGAPAAEVARRRAEIAAARGLGRAAIEDVERAARGSHDAALLVALARLQIQAERDADARRTLTRARRWDSGHPTVALLGAIVDAHDGNFGGAATDADAAEAAATDRGMTTAFRALVRGVRARIRFEASDFADARRLAQEAVALDPLCAEAHLVLADVATENDESPVATLRSAAAGTYPMAEVVGRLAIRLRSGAEACSFARLYAERAPTGYDIRDVRDVLDDCE